MLEFVNTMTRLWQSTRQEKYFKGLKQFIIWIWRLIRWMTWWIAWLMLRVFIHGLVWGAILDEVVKGPTAMASIWVSVHCLNVWAFSGQYGWLLAKINGPNFMFILKANCCFEIVVKAGTKMFPWAYFWYICWESLMPSINWFVRSLVDVSEGLALYACSKRSVNLVMYSCILSSPCLRQESLFWAAATLVHSENLSHSLTVISSQVEFWEISSFTHLCTEPLDVTEATLE